MASMKLAKWCFAGVEPVSVAQVFREAAEMPGGMEAFARRINGRAKSVPDAEMSGWERFGPVPTFRLLALQRRPQHPLRRVRVFLEREAGQQPRKRDKGRSHWDDEWRKPFAAQNCAGDGDNVAHANGTHQTTKNATTKPPTRSDAHTFDPSADAFIRVRTKA
jgi:hypothetical protein